MNSKIRQKSILSATENYIRQTFETEGSGHDWWHIYRVWKLAVQIQKNEGGDLFIIEMAALLHDLDDWKLKSGNHLENETQQWLEKLEVTKVEQTKIIEVIQQVSFKGAGVETPALSAEAKIVQDADRLDAIGAIGIARTFAYGGNKNRLIYNPEIKPEMHENFEAYKNSTAPTINHFYEKLLLLKERLNTDSAKEIAKGRHKFMEDFLQRFFEEWKGKI